MDRKISRNVYDRGENHYTEWLKIRKMLDIQDDEDDSVIWSQEAVILTLQNLFRLDSYKDVDDSFNIILECIVCEADYKGMFEELVDKFGLEVR